MPSPDESHPSPDERAALEACGVVSRETLDALMIHVARLLQWQRKINLIGPATLPRIWTRHVLDSAQLWPLLRDATGPILDIGSGAGFPGLVLGILSSAHDGPEIHLVESDGRKAAFLADIIRRTKARARLHHCRVEALDPWPCAVVTARACAPLPKLIGYGHRFLESGGRMIFLKGRRASAELTEAGEWWRFQATCFESRTESDSQVIVLSDVSARDPGSEPQPPARSS